MPLPFITSATIRNIRITSSSPQPESPITDWLVK